MCILVCMPTKLPYSPPAIIHTRVTPYCPSLDFEGWFATTDWVPRHLAAILSDAAPTQWYITQEQMDSLHWRKRGDVKP